MDFAKKTQDEVAEWLQEQGFSDVIELFKGIIDIL